MLYIKPSAILEGGSALEGMAVLVEGDRIVAVGPARDMSPPAGVHELRAEGLLLAPGFIDLQINGAFGMDFTASPSSIWEVASQLPRYGVTTFLPTIITSPLETIEEAQDVVCSQPFQEFKGARPLGLHLEGPFLNPEKRGAHNPAYLRLPDASCIASWSPQEGVRLVTLAPELPGATALIQTLVERGVVVSAGHSAAGFEEGRTGIEAGIRYGTHLFNAMPPLEHREPGLVGALLADSRVTIGLIADGIHLHPSIVSLVWEVAGQNRVSLVTDAMAALGMQPGQYVLGDMNVRVGETGARLADGRLAGSILSLDEAVRNLVKFTGCTPAEAVATVTNVPAALLGMEDSRGHIAPGLLADMTLLTPDLHVAQTIVAGELVYDAA